MSRFISARVLASTGWRAYERSLSRLLPLLGFEHVSLIGRSGDGGADVLASRGGKRWLFQVKRYSEPVGPEVLERTLEACASYEATVPAVVSRKGFTRAALEKRNQLAQQGINIQLWDDLTLERRVNDASGSAPVDTNEFKLREYQVTACDAVMGNIERAGVASSLVVLATGLGKTSVAGEVIRRISALKPSARILILAHTNELVYQLERSLWPFLRADQVTCICNGVEKPTWSDIERFDVVVASRDTLANTLASGAEAGSFDLIVVDECHHLETDVYDNLLESLGVGAAGGPHLLGLTATPWRPDGSRLQRWFDSPVVSMDLVRGLRSGFLSNVEYRMFTDNINWEGLHSVRGDKLSPRGINRTFFITEWDDAVIDRLRETWSEMPNPRAVVFCGTVSHAERIATQIRSLGFASAAALYSKGSDGRMMSVVDRNRVLWDFAEGRTGVLCAVDVLNEGVDVPDVNIVVFQRVTHSRRIFVQQLGRGLRLAPGKTKVVVLDFVSDIRRFAAGLDLQRAISAPALEGERHVRINSTVRFERAGHLDGESESFLREWLGDLGEAEEVGEDVSLLRFPPEWSH